jgi:hypothetical protein
MSPRVTLFSGHRESAGRPSAVTPGVPAAGAMYRRQKLSYRARVRGLSGCLARQGLSRNRSNASCIVTLPRAGSM